MDLAAKLTQLGFTLPPPPKPVGAYVPAVRIGDLLYISGQIPLRDGKILCTGKVPSAVNIETAQQAAAQCAVQGLSIAAAELNGDISRLLRVIRIGVFVQCDPDFTEQPKVANGASDLLLSVLGDPGKHARAAVGASALPLNATVEVEFLFHVR